MSFYFLAAPVARMLKFYNLPLLTAGGFVYDYNRPKKTIEDEYYLLTKAGISFEPMADFIFKFFKRYIFSFCALNNSS